MKSSLVKWVVGLLLVSAAASFEEAGNADKEHIRDVLPNVIELKEPL